MLSARGGLRSMVRQPFSGLRKRSSAASVRFVSELPDDVGQAGHCQWFDHTVPTFARVLDLMRPNAAIAAGRLPDNGKRLVVQCAATPPAGKPVNRVVRHSGDLPAIARDE